MFCNVIFMFLEKLFAIIILIVYFKAGNDLIRKLHMENLRR